MSIINKPEQVKLFIGMLSCDIKLFSEVTNILEKEFGLIDNKSSIIDFIYTKYYNKEMGQDLKRYFISFKDLIDPINIKEIKIKTNEIEQQFLYENSINRKINLDPGYLTPAKLVLATAKDYSHRIYLGKGIYAEVTMIYEHKKFKFLDWTYPDYQSKEYLDFFYKIRGSCK